MSSKKIFSETSSLSLNNLEDDELTNNSPSSVLNEAICKTYTDYKKFYSGSIRYYSENRRYTTSDRPSSGDINIEIYSSDTFSVIKNNGSFIITEKDLYKNSHKVFYMHGHPFSPKEKEIKEKGNMLELSNYRLDNSGISNENVIRTQKISAQVIEVNNEFVVLECLIDASKRIFQNRYIKKEILEDVIPFKLGQLVLIQIKDLKGGNSIEYVVGDGIISQEDFNADEYFEGLDNSFIDYQD